ncbi:MAG: LssY C-terminal domain-containing protein, partial [Candidatus Sumerlaeaceae bacterium]|nr:LssY C-terminal domain-containing protein [Candidatus Sumerlaeaceae bacterium]
MEQSETESEAPSAKPEPRHQRLKSGATALLCVLLVYGAVTYLVIPFVYSRYAKHHPSLEDIPGITHTGDGHPGDPLNVALVGSEKSIKTIMVAAKWYPADPLTLRSCLEIATATVLKHPYEEAPVSNLFYDGRKEDLAFEQPVGEDPRKRHHVRFWRTQKLDDDGRPFWVGSATYDIHVGFSHATGQITHHIDGAVDVERDHMFDTLKQTGDLVETYKITGF